MFDKIIKFSIENKLIIGVLTLALIIWGTISVVRLPVDATPDITNNQVQIITQAPTLGGAGGGAVYYYAHRTGYV